MQHFAPSLFYPSSKIVFLGQTPSFGADWKEQQKFCSQAATHFMFLKEGWRNHVIHVRDVPYDEGRARSVFGHVREFMQALAEGGLTE
jgi:hypothetical protein